MKKYWILALAVLCAAGFTACTPQGTETSPSSTAATAAPEATAAPTATPEVTATPEATKTPEAVEIGEKTDSEWAYTVSLENKTGKAIMALSVKDSAMESFPESLLSGKTIADGGLLTLHYDSAAAEQTAEEEQGNADLPWLAPQFDVEITLEGGAKHVLHAFPFGDMENGAVLVADGVAYLEYTSVSAAQSVSTLGAEQAIAGE